MFYRQSTKFINNQNGLALLVLIIVIALSFITYTVSRLSITNIKIDQVTQTRIALKKAKQALIAYAVNYHKDHSPRGPGYLLCPDTNNDGDSEPACNGPFTVGRLPWRSLNIGEVLDSSNERLWYAVSENFDYTASPFTSSIPAGIPPRKIINTSTRGNITISDSNNTIIHDGTTNDGVVAVIIAPGIALTRDDGVVQNRSGANRNNAIHYLDIDSSAGEDNVDFDQGTLGGINNNGFIQGEILDVSGNIIVNDIIEVITYDDIMEQVHKRVSQEISNLINDYFTACQAYPEAAAFAPSSLQFDSAVFPLPEGHIPLNSAQPFNWGTGCPMGTAPSPAGWLAEERWDEYTYYAYAYNPPPVINGTCGIGVNPPCMSVNSTVMPINNVQALIMFAGRDTTLSRPSNVMSDYYEGENSNFDNIYDADEVGDYIRVITP